MARRNSVGQLPQSVREWLDKSLVEGNFSGYQLLEEALRDKGFAISKSAIHRYGQRSSAASPRSRLRPRPPAC